MALVYGVAAVGLLALLYVWQRGAYPNYAEGVYLDSSRRILDGALPYRDFVAAHPPLLFYSGAALLSAWDSIDGVRALLALAPLVTGGLVATAVLRLTGSSPGAVLAGLAAIVAPWSLHEHALLMPETFGAPLVMGAALLAARARTAAWAGLLAAVAVGFKWPFLLCGSRWRLRRRPRGATSRRSPAGSPRGSCSRSRCSEPGGSTTISWSPSSRSAGRTCARSAPTSCRGRGTCSRCWCRRPSVSPSGTARATRRCCARSAAAGLAAFVLVGTITKTGTYLNSIVLLEPPLVALAAAGAVWLLREGRPRWGIAAVAAALLLVCVQAASFVAGPDDPGLFLRPFSARGHVWTNADATARAVAAARRCPQGVAYSGQPFIAFVARRRMPGGEPDQFLMAKSPVASRAAAKAAAEPQRCP